MGKLIFVTGGARSGKSMFAESLVKKLGNHILYIATALPFDDEMKNRIALHKKQRPSNWHTIEAYKDIPSHIKNCSYLYDGAMLDCITIMVNNIMMDEITDWDHISIEECNKIEEIVKKEMLALIDYINKSKQTFVIVTNETGSGIVPLYPSSRLYRDVAGRANQMLAKASDEAYLLVSSIAVKIK